MADANVLLRIGSAMGPGGLASLKAGWDMLSGFAGTVTKIIKELDKFKVVLGQVDMSMVNYADSAAKGQVDTFELMKGLQRLNKAGAKITEEQFKILTVRAVDLAKATGKDATEAFERLTRGISRGSSRALTEYGVRVSESTNLQKVQADSIKQLTDGHEDLNIKLETSTEHLKAVENNWGTLKGILYSNIETMGPLKTVLDYVNEALADMNTLLTENVENTASAAKQLAKFNAEARTMMKLQQSALAAPVGGFGAAPFVGMQTAEMLKREERMRGKLNKIKDRETWEGELDDLLQYALEEWYPAEQTESDPLSKAGRVRLQMQIDAYKQSLKKGGGKGRTKGKEAIATYQSSSPYGRLGGQYEPTDTREGTSTEGEYAGLQEAEMARQERLVALKQREFGIEQGIAELKEEQMMSMREAHVDMEERLGLLADEEYQQARLAQLREEDEVYQAEREIYMMYEREQAIDFAHSFTRAWREAYGVVSAGAQTAKYTHDLMSAAWGVYVKSVIMGTGSLKQALKDALVAWGTKIAIEEGIYAAQDFAGSMSAFARREYAKGAQLLQSMAEHLAVMGMGLAVGSLASRIHTGSTGATAAASAGGGAATPSYGGMGYTGTEQGRQEVNIRVYVDDSASFLKIVQDENRMARRSGETSFAEDAA